MSNIKYNFSNKLVIVTAGSKGIGKSIVNSFLDAGARVATFSRNCQNQKDDNLFQLQGDISDSDFLNHFYSSLTTYFDASVDILVNNNGGPTPGLPLSFNDEEWDRAFQNNFYSAVRMSRLVADGMKENKWGRIINLTSASAKEPALGMTLSNVTRSAVISFAKTLSLELAVHGVTVNSILTGGVHTERFNSLVENQISESGESFEDAMIRINATVPVNFIATPEQFSKYILFIASEEASYLNGVAVSIDGGSFKGLF